MASLIRAHHHCSPRRPREPFLQYLARYKAWSSFRARQTDDERETLRLARLPTPDSDDSDSGDAMFAISEMPYLRANSAAQSRNAAITNVGLAVGHGSPPAYFHAPHDPVIASPTESMPQTPSASQPSQTKPRPRGRRQPSRKIIDPTSRIQKSAPYLRSRARVSPVSHFFELDIHGRPVPVGRPTGREKLGSAKALRRGQGKGA